MVKEIKLPEIAENVTEGTVTEILVGEGDTIEAEQDILEMETDKASVEVPAPFGGTVREILISAGDEVSVGQAVMKVDTEEAGDAQEEQPSGGEEKREPKEGDKPGTREPEQGGRPEGHEKGAPGGRGPADERREGESAERPQEAEGAAEAAARSKAAQVPASPGTRRLAREIGIDITEVSGSGSGGRVTSEDVKAFARERGGRAAAPPSGTGRRTREPGGEAHEAAPAPGEGRREKMTRVRTLTAERTTQSWRTVPHVTQHDEADLTQLNRYMQKAAPRVEKAGGKLTVTAVLTKLVAQALRVYPRFNSSADIDAGEIVYHPNVAIGIAADTERGLLVPVVRDPDRKSIVTIALEIGELAKAARSGDLDPSQLQGQTFSISNLGGIGGTAFTPVIVPPCVAILGVARAQTRPVYTGSTFEAHQVLPLSLSYDHRVIDGADGARFVVWLKTAIEDPFAAMMEGGE
jgi:pyruvate dehydrogenase E2 component (dihydrolipoamide acetyltransferase)